MSQSNAPWLEGLDGTSTWSFKPAIPQQHELSSASHEASSLIKKQRQPPRRSFSGNSINSSKKARSPLAPLHMNESNTLRRDAVDSVKIIRSKPADGTPEHGNSMRCGTVEQRSKSASPAKKHESLEWRKRLLGGKNGYGDPTDLFGPSALENIFAPSSKGGESQRKPANKRLNWMPKSEVSMPSSPPPWPGSMSAATTGMGSYQRKDSAPLAQVEETEDNSDQVLSSEYREEHRTSDPFNLHVSESPSVEVANSDELVEDSHHDVHAPGNRTVGGPTELEQEDFSPVFISKHTTVNGKVDYAAIDSHTIKQFKEKHLALRHPSQESSALSSAAGEAVDLDEEEQSSVQHSPSLVAQHSDFTDGPQSESNLAPAQDLSLSENLPTGTPEPLGKFVEVKRGGYSTLGSFRHRPLSAENSAADEILLPMTSEGANHEATSQAHLETRAPTPSLPQTPKATSPAKPKNSPLKLFGPHDTFTNNRLLRRMSELNPEVEEALKEMPASASDAIDAELQVSDGAHSSGKQESRQTSFGGGELDEHVFAAEITVTSASSSEDSEYSSVQSPASDVPVPGSKAPHGFRFESSPDVSGTFKLKRKLSKHAASSQSSSREASFRQSRRSDLQPSVEDATDIDARGSRSRREEGAKAYPDNKRAPTSPAKDPTPKRRRTLHAWEMPENVQLTAAGAAPGTSLQERLHAAVSDGTRKHEDALPGHRVGVASEEALAQRRVMRPRNPTPSQSKPSEELLAQEIKEATDEFLAQEDPSKISEVLEHVEQSFAELDVATLKQRAEVVAAEVAKFTLKVDKSEARDADGERKRSVTTQDFFREAECVMEYIRARAAKKRSILSSVAEVEDPDDSEEDDRSHLSTVRPLKPVGDLRLSREPSWEGRPRSRWREPEQLRLQREDVNMNRVASQLQRWKESDGDLPEEFIARSSLLDAVVDADVDDGPDDAEPDGPEESQVAFDERAQIRITHPSAEQRARERQLEADSRPGSQRSADSSGGSTKKSDNVGTLAPDAVAHLIGSEVGGMTFDRDKQRWVRVRGLDPRAETNGHLDVHESHLTSEDDPFREISDLLVDDGAERRRISSPARLPASQSGPTPIEWRHAANTAGNSPGPQPAVDSRTSSQETVLGPQRPLSRDDSGGKPQKSMHKHSSSAPSKDTFFLESLQEGEVETRATSWTNEQLAAFPQLGHSLQSTLATAAAAATKALQRQSPAMEEDETTPRSFGARNTSSGITQQRHDADVLPSKDFSADSGEAVSNEDNPDLSGLHLPRLRDSASMAPPVVSSAHQSMNQLPLRPSARVNHFTSNNFEQSELSILASLPGDRMMSLSLSVSKPIARRGQVGRVLDPQSSPLKGNSTLLLSDLPDFTVQEEDDERPSERALATKLAHYVAAEVNDRYAFSRKELVKVLTDVYAEEPYWEDLADLDLRGHSLTTLNGLDDFCESVRSLDVSTNGLTQLEGAPRTVRELVARGNQLTDVTSFAHLGNLQYLDLSGNGLRSLAGLGGLVHLRELRADDNEIESLNGVAGLDCLLKMRCRRNKIQEVEIRGGQLCRLKELDLSGNRVGLIHGLENLEALESLKLDGNALQAGFDAGRQLCKLRHLSLRNCGLTRLDVSHLPGLRTLDVDDNALASIGGLDTLEDLESLSMRRQDLPAGKAIEIFTKRLEAHTVRLSGNSMATLSLCDEYLSLKNLELAGVGLQELPDDFGLRMPNLRALNLNSNSLRDIRPLLNIHGLRELQVCGNRLHRLRKSAATLAKMPALIGVDLRDNPITQSFYAAVGPAQANAITSLTRRGCVLDTEDEDEQQARMEAAMHSLSSRDEAGDKAHVARLDEDTKLRRRVYEMLLGHSCKRLERLDGLAFDARGILVKDGVWDRLVELGIVRKPSEALGKAG